MLTWGYLSEGQFYVDNNHDNDHGDDHGDDYYSWWFTF